jgi:putative ABC transport system ATP-binding protein
MDNSMLNINNLRVGDGAKTVWQLDTLTLNKGDQFLLTGSSGSGKTTLLYTLAGLQPALAGNITINNTDITTLSEAQRDQFRGQHIGIIFQTLHLVKSLSVLDNLLLASYVANVAQQKNHALELLDHLGIANKAHELPEQLSQGQAQRVAIARAVLHKPALLLADEPTSSLDDDSCNSVIELITRIARENNTTLIISTHDQRVKSHFQKTLHIGAAA